MRALLVSGEIASGKTTLAQGLGGLWPGEVVSVRALLAGALGISGEDRLELQQRGRELDHRTRGAWLADHLVEHYGDARVIVDAMRTRLQTIPVLERCEGSRLIFLDAPESIRRIWYSQAARSDPVKASVPFDRAIAHVTEREVKDLRAMSVLTIRSDDYSPLALPNAVLHELGEA